MSPLPIDPGESPQWFLLAQRPGWRQIDALSDLDVVDGSVQLRSLAPPPAPPATACAVAGCGDLAFVDRSARMVLFTTGDGQLRRRVGPLALVGDTTAPAAATWQLTPADVWPVEVWPAGTWDPVALVPGPPGRVWVLDPANQCVHEVDRRLGWLSCEPGLVPPARPGCAPSPDPPFAEQGTMTIGPLDSGLEACVWHRIVVEGEIPLGARVGLVTITSEVELTTGELALLPDEEWSATLWNPTSGSAPWDALVQSFPGRYLWLRLVLSGDGPVTPRVDDIEVHFPRQTSIRHLPAAFAGGPDDGAFLDRFLALTDQMRGTVTVHLDDTPVLLDPHSTPSDPADDFLAWLSAWMGVDDVASLPVGRRRRLLAAAAELYRVRGTPDGVRQHVSLWLGREVALLEHYRLRRWAVVHHGHLGDTSRLFGPEVVRRLQLDEFSTIGAFRLIDVPDPLRDPFHFYAHRFTLVVRARRHDDVDALADQAAHVVAVVAPAHCLAEVAVVSPSLRVGVQATVGLDALVGGAPDPEPLGTGRLGQAAVVAADPHHHGARLGQHTRVSRTRVA
jgi:phage tail-like protein